MMGYQRRFALAVELERNTLLDKLELYRALQEGPTSQVQIDLAPFTLEERIEVAERRLAFLGARGIEWEFAQ
jgi:hypothetical protein